jgi:hypothetical protein
MTRSRTILIAALVPLTLAAPVSARGAAFGPAQALDLPVAGPLAAAVGPGGEAVVAGVSSAAAVEQQVEVATRAGSGAPWKVAALGPAVSRARDVQVVIARGRAVVAWAETRRRRPAVVVATGDLGGALKVRRRLAVADAFAASPRLTRLRSGAVVVAWRDGRFRARSSVRVATIDGDRFATAPLTVGRDAAQVVLAARGAGATIGWTSTYRLRPGSARGSMRRAMPRTLTVRALGAGGLPTGPATTVGRDVSTTVRLAGAPDGRLVASWVRPQQIRPYPGEDHGAAPPPEAYVAPLAFTRQLLPHARPPRPLGGPGEIPAGAPSVAFDDGDHAVAAVRVATPRAGPAFDVVTAGARAGGPWTSTSLIAHLGFSGMDPVAAAPAAGDVVIVYTALVAGVGTAPSWTIAATDASGAHPLGITTASDGRGVAVARASARVLVAWPAGGRVQVAERG